MNSGEPRLAGSLPQLLRPEQGCLEGDASPGLGAAADHRPPVGKCLKGLRMAARRRTEITIETDRVLVIRRQGSIPTWCSQCGCEVETVSVEDADDFSGFTREAIQDPGRAGKLHVSQGQNGQQLVCLPSLLKSI